MTSHEHKTFIVTGANSGVGLETARGLARTGASVVMTARNREKGERALDDVRRTTGNDAVRLQMLDLASLADVRRAADALLESCPRIDGLINNAGLGAATSGTTQDGLELIVGTNHVGPFVLTEALIDRLLETARTHGSARIVNVSSLAHKFARGFAPEGITWEGPAPSAHRAYADSKMANLLHARELARRHGEAGLRAHAVHPGFVNSGFMRADHYPGAWQLVAKLTRPMQVSPEDGAKPSLHAALSDEGGRLNGFYFVKESTAKPKLPDDVLAVQERLWTKTEEVVASVRGVRAAA